jgi:pimeloyl-ACP methyl ester carboxylesterase
MRQEHFLSLGPNGFHRIAYTDWGAPGARHIVVCAHGLTRNSRDFDYLARALADRCRVVCMDVVGRGRSDWLARKQGYGFRQYQADAAALIARVSAPHGLARWLDRLRGNGSERTIDWVGTSMGGIIGMLLAAQPGSPIRRLVLNDVGPLVPWPALMRLKGYASRGTRFPDLAAVERHLREVCASFGPLEDEHWRHLALHSARETEDGYQLAYDPGITASLWNGADLEMPLGSDLTQGLNLWRVWSEVRAKTLVLRGVESDVLSAHTARDMQARGPGAQVVELAGIGHAPALMSDEQIALVREFLLSEDPRKQA